VLKVVIAEPARILIPKRLLTAARSVSVTITLSRQRPFGEAEARSPCFFSFHHGVTFSRSMTKIGDGWTDNNLPF
jgi:hypothetical protein